MKNNLLKEIIKNIIKEELNIGNLRLPQKYDGDLSKLTNINYSDIDFIQGETKGNTIYFDVNIDGYEDISKSINFDIQVINDILYHPHIELAGNIQKYNIGYKLLKQFITLYGHFYASKGRTLSDNIIKLINKLNTEQGITCVKNETDDWLCYQNNNSDLDIILNNFKNEQ